jgi:Cof subfamily protein (haloacid dehalogenase superfamily)
VRYKLIAIDLDGTLLPDGRIIPEGNIRAIEYATAKGITVVIATGRVTTSGRAFARQLNLETYIISSNGARIYDISKKDIIYEDGLCIEDAKAVAGYFEGFGVYYHAYVDDIMYARYMREPLLFYTELNKKLDPDLRMDIRICDNFDQIFEENKDKISKVMTIESDLKLIAAMRRDLLKNGNIVVMASREDNIEVMNHTVGKGKALMHLAKKLGVERDEVIAIGDNDNDLSMIEWAGTGIAMGNAIDEVKIAANDITDRCEELGVAKTIYKYI